MGKHEPKEGTWRPARKQGGKGVDLGLFQVIGKITRKLIDREGGWDDGYRPGDDRS